MRDGGRERSWAGQATIETIALLPLVAVLAALGWQAVVAGHAVWLSGSAARAAARAVALGQEPEPAARRALPSWLRGGVSAVEGDGGVRVSVRIPVVVGGARLGRVSTEAALPPQDG
jgi:hypothetical protein